MVGASAAVTSTFSEVYITYFSIIPVTAELKCFRTERLSERLIFFLKPRMREQSLRVTPREVSSYNNTTLAH